MEHCFDTRKEASVAAADRIATALVRRLDGQGAASLVVSGGTTPALCFAALSKLDLAWDRVGILASDERWVPGTDDASNEKLIRETLLVERAAAADFLPYYSSTKTVEERCIDLDAEIRFVPFPFACALLGMGTDGHFASLFPDAKNLDAGLDLESQSLCLPVITEASPHPRITLTLAALSRSDEIVLLFFGEDKKIIYEKAKAGNARYPVTRLLKQKRAPVHIYWAP
jgi:6-phosphogluconolactonase